jgi:KipI family sensor histidine kinase inhibitor
VTSARPVRAFGDSAVVIDVDSVAEAHELAAAIDEAEMTGIEDVIVGFRSVTVVADPTATDISAQSAMLASIRTSPAPPSTVRLVEIPVALDGADLDDVARLAQISPSLVADLLTGTDLHVAFVGFAPGFAYLDGLPPVLASVPRRPTPRPAVAGGSLALAGGFAAVYPQTSPGGWHVVGRTGMRLFDPDTPPYSVLRPGDLVRLCPAEVPDTPDDALPVGPRRSLRSDAERRLVIEDPGLLAFVEDGGRVGVARLGVPRAGAADPYGLRMANRLVGNDQQAAAIETTARGPRLRFSAPAHVAVVGTAEVRVDGRTVPGGAVLPVAGGQTLTTGDERGGLRSYIAVSGGIDIPTVLGSRSSDVLCGLGVGPLVSGDVLGLGLPGRPRGRLRSSPKPGTTASLRIMAGPDVFPTEVVDRLISSTWEVAHSSDRIGVRLRGERPLDGPAPGIASRGMITGAIQIPPDGQPIVLLCDHATVGGYPVIATVVSADTGVLGQLRAGDDVRFSLINRPEAARARSEREQVVETSVIGWYPVRTD